MAGGIGGLPNSVGPSQIQSSFSAQAQDQADDISALIKEVVRNVSDLTDELSGKVRLQTSKNELPQQENLNVLSTAQQDQKTAGTTVQFQPKDERAQLDQGQKPAQATTPEEAALAALIGEDDPNVKGKKRKTSLEKKLEKLAALESLLMDVEFETPEEKEMMKEFFENMNRMKNLQERLRQLDYSEKQYEELLARQNAAEQAKKQPVKLASHHGIGIAPVKVEVDQLELGEEGGVDSEKDADEDQLGQNQGEDLGS